MSAIAEGRDDWPDDVATARVRLERLEQRQGALLRKPKLDRSAVDQDEIDALTSSVPAMRRHIEMLERMAK